MRSEKDHNEIYRAALDSANAELTEISVEFERLTIRRDRIEKLLVALQPFVELKEAPAGAVIVASQPAQKSATTEPPKREAEPMAADPFQRRVDHVLGIGAGIRDVRQFTRQF